MTLPFETLDLGPVGSLPASDMFDRGVALDPSMREAFIAHGTAEQNLNRLFDEGALCITTGQQPGLFTGPLYTIHKALAAVALARRCERLADRAVVPVFWVAGDDHDFAESNHCHLISQKGELERLQLRERTLDAPSTPMYREVLGTEVEVVRDRLNDVLPESEFTAIYLELIGRHYHAEATLAEAFAGTMAELLGVFGLVVFRPTKPAAKVAAAGHIQAALEKSSQLMSGLIARSVVMEEAAQDVPVKVREGETLVMFEAAQGRDRLLYGSDSFTTRRSGESFTAGELYGILKEQPERFSPNVLLRPVVEAGLLPTIAYVAGAGERKYLAQIAPLYEALGVSPQAFVTRWGGRAVEGRVAKTLARYDLSFADLRLPAGQVDGRLASDHMPPEVSDAIEALKEGLEGNYGRLIEAASQLDPTIQKPVESALHRSQKELAGIEKRIVGLLKQRNATLIRQVGAARVALFPAGREQERVLNVLQFLSRYGDGVLESVLEACESWAATVQSD